MTSAASDFPVGEIRRIFESVVAIDAERREQWLLENVPDPAVRHVVARLLAADERPGILDSSVLTLLDAAGFTGRRASRATRAPTR